AKLSDLGNKTDGDNSGFSYEVGGGKKSGTFRWNLSQVLTDDKFDPTDMGFFNNNNFFTNELYLGINKYKPGKWYNQFEAWFELDHTQRFTPRSYQSFDVEIGTWAQFK